MTVCRCYYNISHVERKSYYFSRHGTTHKVNNLILLGTFANQNNSVTFSPKRKRSRCSFVPDSNLVELNYHHRKRFGPLALCFPENEASEMMLDESNKRNFITLMRYKTTGRHIPSWTGFQILISNNIPILKTAVGYLDCIDSSAAETSTIYQVFFCFSCIFTEYLIQHRLFGSLIFVFCDYFFALRHCIENIKNISSIHNFLRYIKIVKR